MSAIAPTSTGVGATGVLGSTTFASTRVETAATSSTTSSFALAPRRDARHRRRVRLAARRRWRWRCSAYARPGTRIAAGRVPHRRRRRRSACPRAARRALARPRASRTCPQNPATALSPGMRIGAPARRDRRGRTSARPRPRRARARGARARRSCPDDDAFLRRYPHQLCGGQQQRVAIAMALVCQPDVIVMDEPTTGLDVTTQARLLERDPRAAPSALGTAIVYVSHDLGVVRNIADRVAVHVRRPRRRGGPSTTCSASRGILHAPPARGRSRASTPGACCRAGSPGRAVEPWNRPAGCVFAPRCDSRGRRLPASMPPLEATATARVRCLRVARLASPRRRVAVARAAADGRRDGCRGRRRCVLGHRRAASRGVPWRRGRRGRHGVVARGAPRPLPRHRRRERQRQDDARSAASPACTPRRTGPVALDGAPLAAARAPLARASAARIQLVSQNPDASLNPRQSVGEIVGRPLRAVPRPARRGRGRARRRAARARCACAAAFGDRCPRELSRRREAARRDRPRRSPPSPSCCSATRSRRRSTSPCRRASSRCSTSCGRDARHDARCSSRTTSPSCARSATTSW